MNSSTDLLARHASVAPDKCALHYCGTDYSYARLEQIVEQLCGLLYAKGIRSGMTLVCLDEQRLLTALLFFAAPRLGYVLLPVNPLLAATDLALITAQANAKTIITSELLDQALACNVAATAYPLAKLAVTDTALILATSGTQAQPRLVALSYAALHSSAVASVSCLSLQANSSWLLCLPLFHIGGLSVLFRCMLAQAKIVLHTGFYVADVLLDLQQKNISHVSFVPAMLQQISVQDSKMKSPSHLQVVLLGGAVLGSKLAQWALDLHWPLFPTYGMTETSSQVATLTSSAKNWYPGNVGKVLAHMQIKIDEHSERILVRGDGLMQGYVQADGRFELPLSNGWFETGDLGQVTVDGHLIILGRADDVLISGGENVHPAAIEAVMLQCAGIDDVAVTAVADDRWGDKIVALYTGVVTETDVMVWCKDNLSGVMLPKAFKRVDRLPYGVTGKLQRKVLPMLFE